MHAFPERAKQSRYISSQAWHNFPLQLCSHACRFPARGGKKGWWNARDPFPPTFSIITALPSTLLTKFRSSFSPTISILLGESLTLVLINVRDDETIESKCWSKIVLNSFANFATFMLMKRKEQVLRGLLSDQYFRFPI